MRHDATSTRPPRPTPLTRVAALTATIVSACASASLASSAAERPHIVLYLSDDHGVDFVGAYGNAAVRTPNIDALARDGLRFDGVFAASPTCTPSRSALYTGLYPARNGAMGNHTTCRAGTRSLPSYLRALGYRVVLANKVHVKPPEVFDFEHLDATLPRRPAVPRRYRAEGLDVGAVDRLLEEHAHTRPDTPLCLVLADNSPHVTWEPNRSYDPAELPLSPILVDTPTTRRALANYYQDITTMDERVGAVRASLKRHGMAGSTLFIYTSDQGPEWPRCKWTVHDTGLRVPFIAVWPGEVRPRTTTDALVSFVDVLPTFVAVAGGPPPAGLDGRSFLPALRGEASTHREHVFASHTGDGDMNVFPQRAVRTRRYKYILNLRPENEWTTHFTKVAGIPDSHRAVWDEWIEKAGRDEATRALLDRMRFHRREELYDLEEDPWELHDLARDPAVSGVLEELRRTLNQWMVEQADPGLDAAQRSPKAAPRAETPSGAPVER